MNYTGWIEGFKAHMDYCCFMGPKLQQLYCCSWTRLWHSSLLSYMFQAYIQVWPMCLLGTYAYCSFSIKSLQPKEIKITRFLEERMHNKFSLSEKNTVTITHNRCNWPFIMCNEWPYSYSLFICQKVLYRIQTIVQVIQITNIIHVKNNKM
jgi:hypothetical protein